MLKRLGYILFILFAALSCKKEDLTYTGAPFVDFPSTYRYFVISGNTNTDTIIPVSVRLVGAQSGNATNVTFEVDTSSTAVSGTHYEFTSTTIQIPANSSYGSIPVKFLVPSFPEQTKVTLVLKLTGGDLATNPNYNTAYIDVYRQGFIDLFIGNYSVEEPDEPVSVKYNVVVAEDTTVKNRVMVSNFWNFAKDGSDVYLDFKSTVDSVYLPSQTFTDQMDRTYTVSGSGSYTISDGSFTINYTLSEDGGTFTEQNLQVYSRK